MANSPEVVMTRSEKLSSLKKLDENVKWNWTKSVTVPERQEDAVK